MICYALSIKKIPTIKLIASNKTLLVPIRHNISSDLCKLLEPMYKLANWTSILIAVLLAALGFAQKADLKELKAHSELLALIVAWLQKNVWILVPLLSGSLLFLKWLKSFLGEPWVKKAVHSFLTV